MSTEETTPRVEGLEQAGSFQGEAPAAQQVSSSSCMTPPDVSASAPVATSSTVEAGQHCETPSAAPSRRTRLLKDVEEEENRFVYEQLYRSLEDSEDVSIRDELTVGDTVRQARAATQAFKSAAALPVGEKAKGCGLLLRSFAEERNRRVARVFLLFTTLMFTLPVGMLLVGMKTVAPRLELDPTLCGGGLAVLTTVVLMSSYVGYAFVEDMRRSPSGRQEDVVGATKKNE